MSDSPDDKPASTPPLNEQESPPAETEIEPSPLTPAEPVAAAETDSDPVPSNPTQPATAVEEAEGGVPHDEPARPSPQDAVDVAGQDQDQPVAPVHEAPVAPVSEAPAVPVHEAPVAPVSEAPAVPVHEAPVAPVQEAPVAPVAAEDTTPGAGAATPVRQDPPAAPEALRPVFDPAPPPPRDDAPPEPPETPVSDPSATAPLPEPLAVPAAGGDAAAEPPLDEGDEPTSSPRSSLARRWPLLLLPLVVIAVVVAAFAVKSNTDKAVDKVKTKAAFVTFADKEKGFSVKYPATWKRVGRPNDELRLLVKDEGLDSLLVRVVPTPAPFPADLTGEEAKQVADVVLKRETFAPERILREQAVNVNGAPGYYYLYTFDEEVKGEGPPQKVQGVHAHYIVFSGRRIFILVFQALPTANFDKLAPTFDAMAESFKITPVASDAPDPTTAPDPAVPPAEPAPTDTSVPAPAGQ